MNTISDEEFCREFVRRHLEIDPKNNSKTKGDIRKIVIKQQSIPIENMFKDDALLDVLGGLHRRKTVEGWVYSFVRDNQHLFVKTSEE